MKRFETCTSTWSILGNPTTRVSKSIIKNVLDQFVCKYLYILWSCSLVLYINPPKFYSTRLFHFGVIIRLHLIDLRTYKSSATICNKASSGDKLAYGEIMFPVDIDNFSSTVGIVVFSNIYTFIGHENVSCMAKRYHCCL